MNYKFTAFYNDLLLSFVVFNETISLATDSPNDSGNFSITYFFSFFLNTYFYCFFFNIRLS